jgi:hypothetical protein
MFYRNQVVLKNNDWVLIRDFLLKAGDFEVAIFKLVAFFLSGAQFS